MKSRGRKIIDKEGLLLLRLLLLLLLHLPYPCNAFLMHPAVSRAPPPRLQPQLPAAAATDKDITSIFSSSSSSLLVVSTARFPLIGFPSWAPKLHTAVVLQKPAAAAPDKSSYLLFDFVPANPTEAKTALSLFGGQRVQGIVREKVLSFEPPVLVEKGTCRRSLEEIRGFCAAYDAQLGLLSNNCYTFEERLLAFLLI